MFIGVMGQKQINIIRKERILKDTSSKNNNLGNLNKQQKTAKISHLLVKDGLEVKRGMLEEEKPQTNKIERKGRRKKTNSVK